MYGIACEAAVFRDELLLSIAVAEGLIGEKELGIEHSSGLKVLRARWRGLPCL